MRNPEDVKKNDEERLKQNWRDEFRTTDAYVAFKDVFMNMLSDFE